MVQPPTTARNENDMDSEVRLQNTEAAFNASRIIRMLLLCLLPVLFLASLSPAPTRAASIVAIRSEQSSLPESIRRETYAAIERAREMLLALDRHNGLWTVQDGSSTIFPALAFCDPKPELQADVVSLSVTTSLKRIEINLSKPWSPSQAMEAVYTALAESVNFNRPINSRILTRLLRVQRTTLKHTDSALLLMALEANGIPIDGDWQAIVNNLQLTSESDITSVTIAALGRLKSKVENFRPPREDVIAHTRWIARRIALREDDRLSSGADLLTPEAAFFITVLASQLPRQILAEDPTLFPYDWRNHIASRLIAQQRKDPTTGLDYWDTALSPSPDSESALEATTYAVMTLVILVE